MSMDFFKKKETVKFSYDGEDYICQVMPFGKEGFVVQALRKMTDMTNPLIYIKEVIKEEQGSSIVWRDVDGETNPIYDLLAMEIYEKQLFQDYKVTTGIGLGGRLEVNFICPNCGHEHQAKDESLEKIKNQLITPCEICGYHLFVSSYIV